ncbi:uncharacterized protein si:ch211-176l24.4 [Scophthalmus maximus]|uniref:uncharacterized protein si:ch211-176l24.4 n=1 Tax=Scophthalmus maximus TaxID=52904 RepID=UPI001FA86B8F|nr:uncharacterized protein si:ch211-176l24.4 [Scophthalmus maximus]
MPGITINRQFGNFRFLFVALETASLHQTHLNAARGLRGSGGLFEVERVGRRLMCDFEDRDAFWEFLISPGKGKRKRKNSQKAQKCVKRRNDIDAKTNESNYDDAKKKKKMKKKKKKNPKYKEAMGERKVKKKEWKKKNKASVALDDSFIFTQGVSGESGPAAKPEPKPDRVQTKTKRKKVAFDLSPRYIPAKRPKFVPSTPKEKHVAGGGESRSPVAATQRGQTQPSDDDSPCASDDINSQDLFITQKTFRTSPREPSGGEALGTTPPPIARPLPDGSNLQQRRKRDEEQMTASKEEEEEEEERWLFTQRRPEEESFPRQTESNSNPRGANPFLDDPVVVNSSLDVSKSCPSSRQSPPGRLDSDDASPLPRRTSNSTTSSTQTENFFTAELSSYLRFCQKSLRVENAEALDLSLPLRARNDLGRCSSVTETGHGGPGRRPSCSSDSKDAEVKKEEPPGRQRCSVRLQRKLGKRTPSPQSESEAKSADAMTSSEDCDATGKPDLTQVRAVQTRLNESFFFKAKGDGPSQRPASPLMKLAQGREVTGGKGRQHPRS